MLNVKDDFNAAGNGCSDDAPALRFALRSLSPGDTLYFPHGKYRLKSAVKSNYANKKREYLSLEQFGVTLKFSPLATLSVEPPDDHDSSYMYYVLRLPVYATLSDIAVEGGLIEATIVDGFYPIGLRDEGTAALNVHGVRFSRLWYGVNICGLSTGVAVNNCSFNGHLSAAIAITNGRKIKVIGCDISDTCGNTGAGVRIEPNDGDRVESVRLIGNELSNNVLGLSAVKPRQDGRFAIKDLWIERNRVRGGSRAVTGIHLAGGIHCATIERNIVGSMSKERCSAGVAVAGYESRDVHIRGNIIRYCNYGVWWNRNEGDYQLRSIVTGNDAISCKIPYKIDNPEQVIFVDNL